MSFLLDASALIPLVMRSGKRIVVESRKFNLCTTELGIYEGYNGFWKLSTLLKIVSFEDAKEMVALLNELAVKNIISTISFASLDLPETLQIAVQNQLTFYDASYIAASQNAPATLVTDDRKLCKAANKIIKAITFEQFQTRHS